MTMTNLYPPKQRVTFDDAQEGPQSGVVLGILKNISNGQDTAAIEVDFSLPGVVWHVPVIELTMIAN
jgi:hypothetical protein